MLRAWRGYSKDFWAFAVGPLSVFGELERRDNKAERDPNLRAYKIAIRRECRGSWVSEWMEASLFCHSRRPSA